MASSSADAHSQPKRPPAMARQSSTSSQVSQSPSEGGYHKTASHKTQRQHVVGTARVQRNVSTGKNLNKLNKIAQAHGGDGNTAKHHRRSHSGNSTSAPSSPRPGFKRNASSGGIVRAANHAHTHTAIRKNMSSGHLARLGSSSKLLKSSKSEVASTKKALAQAGRSRQSTPEEHHTVHFDVGDVDDDDEEDEDEHDDGWTEESASQSPTTTRSNTRANTRSNSVVLDPQPDPQRIMSEAAGNTGESSASEGPSYPPPTSALTQALPDRTLNSRLNGSSPHPHSRPPDADMITSRLLQRSSSHNPPPQMSSIAATVVSSTRDARDVGRSAGSTLVDTPGRDLVSRFMDGDGSAGTPKDGSSFLPSRNSPQGEGGELDKSKRNKSMPNVTSTGASTGASTPSRTQARRSGTSTPTDLPPSRTQQKLMLQRASSNIEPQKLVPVILPRSGGPNFTSGMTYTASAEGRLDPRLQQQFNHVTIEYKVVRRYRNPLADALVRIEQTPGTPRKARVPRSVGTNGFANTHGSNSLGTSFNDSTVETGGSGPRRSPARFETGRASREGDMEGRQSFDSENEHEHENENENEHENESDRVRNEAEEICRRLWDSTEVVEGD